MTAPWTRAGLTIFGVASLVAGLGLVIASTSYWQPCYADWDDPDTCWNLSYFHVAPWWISGTMFVAMVLFAIVAFAAVGLAGAARRWGSAIVIGVAALAGQTIVDIVVIQLIVERDGDGNPAGSGTWTGVMVAAAGAAALLAARTTTGNGTTAAGTTNDATTRGGPARSPAWRAVLVGYSLGATGVGAAGLWVRLRLHGGYPLTMAAMSFALMLVAVAVASYRLATRGPGWDVVVVSAPALLSFGLVDLGVARVLVGDSLRSGLWTGTFLLLSGLATLAVALAAPSERAVAATAPR